MRLFSPAFIHDEMIPTKNTCDGLDISPPLRWSEVPEETQSLALTVKDLEEESEWIHWLVCNIRPESRFIPEGGPVPRRAREIQNDFGKQAYGGPCPSSGEHCYLFTLYALDTERLPSRVRKENFIPICERHTVEKAELVGRYRAGGPPVGI